VNLASFMESWSCMACLVLGPKKPWQILSCHRNLSGQQRVRLVGLRHLASLVAQKTRTSLAWASRNLSPAGALLAQTPTRLAWKPNRFAFLLPSWARRTALLAEDPNAPKNLSPVSFSHQPKLLCPAAPRANHWWSFRACGWGIKQPLHAHILKF